MKSGNRKGRSKRSASPRRVKSPTIARRPSLVYVVGDPPLVDEFTQLCRSHNVRVAPSTKSIPSKVTIAVELTNIDPVQKRRNLEKLDHALSNKGVLFSSSVTVTAAEQATWIRHPERLVGISAFPTLLSQKLIEFAPGPATTKENLLRAQDFFIQLGKQISVVQDRIGMVMPRILCMIINEAYFALQEGIASPQDVDVAMKLGTNYPHGPVEWGEKIGLQQVSAVLQALQNDLREDRYRMAPLLKQMVSQPISYFR